jgi:hypothetical protein
MIRPCSEIVAACAAIGAAALASAAHQGSAVLEGCKGCKNRYRRYAKLSFLRCWRLVDDTCKHGFARSPIDIVI